MSRNGLTIIGGLAALPMLAGCFSIFPEPKEVVMVSPRALLSQAGSAVSSDVQVSADHKGYECPAGNLLPMDRVVVTGGFPAPFDFEIENEPTFVAAEIAIAGGTLTRLSPGAVRSSSVRDGQTVEMARMPLAGTDAGKSHLRFSVVPITGTREGGPETVQVYARVLEDTGSALAVTPVIAGSQQRLCGPY
ncbi:MAG: hypothetical protein HRU11_11865 [Parvularculaceae bacterium]|nr:hypothetical protein [Parvularculaceae bacterium]